MDITSKCYMCIQWTLVICYLVITQQSNLLYTDIDLKLRNKSHGTVHYKIGVTCIYNGHVFYTLSTICVMNSRVSGQYAIL